MTALYAVPAIKDFLAEPLKDRQATLDALGEVMLNTHTPRFSQPVNKAHSILKALSDWSEGL